MPKFPTFPTLYDDLKTISISDLKRWEYLKPDQFKNGEMTWSRGGNKTGSISFAVNTQAIPPYIELDYKASDKPINYRVRLTSILSNLSKGYVWFFICPHTGKRCRKLHLASGYFYHRSAFTHCMYEKQTHSRKSRSIGRLFEKCFGSEKAYEKIYSKNFKKHYNGKPTKQYLKLMKQIEKSERITENDLLKYLYF